jgi:hypothetical protein
MVGEAGSHPSNSHYNPCLRVFVDVGIALQLSGGEDLRPMASSIFVGPWVAHKARFFNQFCKPLQDVFFLRANCALRCIVIVPLLAFHENSRG